MRATILVDNKENGNLCSEWGLSVYIEYASKKILLDTGASELFCDNAEKLGIDLTDIDIAVLSHAHYDHGNGMPKFFEINKKAKFYVSSACRENCYSTNGEKGLHYIGLPKGVLESFADRIVKVEGRTEIAPGVTLLPHSTPNLESIGQREHLFVSDNGEELTADDFSHEQSLIFSVGKGLAVFNSCCHAGAANIISEVNAAFPDKRTIALIGGFHLFNRTQDEVRAFADEVRRTGIEYIFTGHCTGDEAYNILSDELGDIVHPLRCGLTMSFADLNIMSI